MRIGAFAAVAAGTAALPVTLPVQRSAILDTGTNVLLLPPELLSRLGQAMCADASLAHCRTLWGDPLSSSSCVALSKHRLAPSMPTAKARSEALERDAPPLGGDVGWEGAARGR